MSVQILNDAENLLFNTKETEKEIYCREVLIHFPSAATAAAAVSIDQIYVESSSRFVEVFISKTNSLDSEEYFETFHGDAEEEEVKEGDLWFSVFVEKRIESVHFLRLKMRRASCLKNVIVIVDNAEVQYKVTIIKDDGTFFNATTNRKDSAVELESSFEVNEDVVKKIEMLEHRVEYLEQQVKTLLEIIKGKWN